MSWLLNRQEKEDYVNRLYNEGRSVREIAELAHMSFLDIGVLTVKEDMPQMKNPSHLNLKHSNCFQKVNLLLKLQLPWT
jgi:hypothetical protein